jgi:hypothetical protein
MPSRRNAVDNGIVRQQSNLERMLGWGAG